MFKGLVDSDGRPAQLMVGDTIYIRRSDKLVRVSLRENEVRVGGIARASGLMLTSNDDSHINFFISKVSMSTEEVAMMLGDILAIVGISTKLVENSHHGLLYEIVSTDYAQHTPDLESPSVFKKTPVEQSSRGFRLVWIY